MSNSNKIKRIGSVQQKLKLFRSEIWRERTKKRTCCAGQHYLSLLSRQSLVKCRVQPKSNPQHNDTTSWLLEGLDADRCLSAVQTRPLSVFFNLSILSLRGSSRGCTRSFSLNLASPTRKYMLPAGATFWVLHSSTAARLFSDPLDRSMLTSRSGI